MDALCSPDGFTPRKRSRLSLSRLKREKRLREQEQSESNDLAPNGTSLEAVAEAKSTIDVNEGIGMNIETGIDTNVFDSPEKQSHDDDDDDDLKINLEIDDSSSSSEDEEEDDVQSELDEGFHQVGHRTSGSKNVMLDDDSSSDSEDSMKPSRSNSLKRKRIVIDEDDEREDESVTHQTNFALHSKYSQSSFLQSPTKSENDDMDHYSTESFGLAQHTASPLQSPRNNDIDNGTGFQNIVRRNFFDSEAKKKPDQPPSNVREGLRTPSCQMKNRSIYRKQSPIETDDIESSCESSDEDDGSDDDDLVILSPKKQRAKPGNREVICLDSDEESEDGKPYASERNSFLPSWGSGSKSFSASKETENTSSSAISILNGKNRSQKVRKSKSSNSTATSTRRLTRVSTSETNSASSSLFERRDIIGGSGLGLGGFQVQRSDDNDEENQENGSTKGTTAGGRRKAAKKKTSSSKTKADAATKKKARKTKGRKTKKGGRRNYRSRKRSGSDAWSTNDRGISNYRGRGRGRGRGGGSRVTNPQPYMNISKADPIGNTGGASITF